MRLASLYFWFPGSKPSVRVSSVVERKWLKLHTWHLGICGDEGNAVKRKQNVSDVQLMMEPTRTSETSVKFCQIKWRYNPDDSVFDWVSCLKVIFRIKSKYEKERKNEKLKNKIKGVGQEVNDFKYRRNSASGGVQVLAGLGDTGLEVRNSVNWGAVRLISD